MSNEEKNIEKNQVPDAEPVRGDPPLIYFYNPFNHEYVKNAYPDPDQQNPLSWLYPAYTTLVKPLEYKDKFAIVFNIENLKWEYIEDHRGEIWYNKENGDEVIIDYLGEIKDELIQRDKPVFPEPEKPMPRLTQRQIRRALLSVGKLDMVDTFINTMKSPEKEAAQIDWDYASSFDWNNPLVKALIPNLGENEEEVKKLWLKWGEFDE